LVSAAAPGGGWWHPTASGFKYANAALGPDGIKTMSLKSGARAKLHVQGKGGLLGLPPTLAGVGLPMVVQLKNNHGVCFEADFRTSTLNTAKSFRAKGG